MSVEWVNHKGKQILVNDCRGCSPETIVENLDQVVRMVEEVPPSASILLLNNVDGATMDTMVMTHLKKSAKAVAPRIEKDALVGIQGIRHVLLAAVNRVTGAKKIQKLFDDHEEALDWLAS